MNWQNHINIERLPEDYQLIASVIGLENTIKLAYAMPSVHIYFSRPDRLFLPAKVSYIKYRHDKAGPDNPFNVRLIAIECGVSERFVYDVIAEREQRGKQAVLFD